MTAMRDSNARKEREWDDAITAAGRREEELIAKMALKEAELVERAEAVAAAEKAATERLDENEELVAWKEKYSELVKNLDDMVAAGDFDRKQQQQQLEEEKDAFQAFRERKHAHAEHKRHRKTRRRHLKEMEKQGPSPAPPVEQKLAPREYHSYSTHHTRGDNHARLAVDLDFDDEEDGTGGAGAAIIIEEEEEEEEESDEEDDSDDDGKPAAAAAAAGPPPGKPGLVLVRDRHSHRQSNINTTGADSSSSANHHKNKNKKKEKKKNKGKTQEEEEGDEQGEQQPPAFTARLFERLQEKEITIETQKKTISGLQKEILTLTSDILIVKQTAKNDEERAAREVQSMHDKEQAMSARMLSIQEELNKAVAGNVKAAALTETLQIELKQSHEQSNRHRIREGLKGPGSRASTPSGGGEGGALNDDGDTGDEYGGDAPPGSRGSGSGSRMGRRRVGTKPTSSPVPAPTVAPAMAAPVPRAPVYIPGRDPAPIDGAVVSAGTHTNSTVHHTASGGHSDFPFARGSSNDDNNSSNNDYSGRLSAPDATHTPSSSSSSHSGWGVEEHRGGDTSNAPIIRGAGGQRRAVAGSLPLLLPTARARATPASSDAKTQCTLLEPEPAEEQQQQQQGGGNNNLKYPHPGGNNYPQQQQQPVVITYTEAETQTSLEHAEVPIELPLLRIFRALRALVRATVPRSRDVDVPTTESFCEESAFFPLFTLAVEVVEKEEEEEEEEEEERGHQPPRPHSTTALQQQQQQQSTGASQARAASAVPHTTSHSDAMGATGAGSDGGGYSYPPGGSGAGAGAGSGATPRPYDHATLTTRGVFITPNIPIRGVMRTTPTTATATTTTMGGGRGYGGVRVRFDNNPAAHPPSSSARDLAAAAAAAAAPDSAASNRNRTPHNADAAAAKMAARVRDTTSFLVAANGMRNRVLAELALWPTWDTANARMLVRCLDLVLQGAYSCLTSTAVQDSSSKKQQQQQQAMQAGTDTGQLRELDYALRGTNLPSFLGGAASAPAVLPVPLGAAAAAAEGGDSGYSVSVVAESSGSNGNYGNSNGGGGGVSGSQRHAMMRSLVAASMTQEELAREIHRLLGSYMRQQQQQQGGSGSGSDATSKSGTTDTHSTHNALELWTPEGLLHTWAGALGAAQSELAAAYRDSAAAMNVKNTADTSNTTTATAAAANENNTGNNIAAVSPRGRPTTGEPYRAAVLASQDPSSLLLNDEMMMPLKQLLDGHVGSGGNTTGGMSRGFLAKTLVQQRNKARSYRADAEEQERRLAQEQEQLRKQMEPSVGASTHLRRSLDPTLSGNPEALDIVQTGMDLFLADKQEQEALDRTARREQLLQRLEASLQAQAGAPCAGDMNFATAQLYSSANNYGAARVQAQAHAERVLTAPARAINDDDGGGGGGGNDGAAAVSGSGGNGSDALPLPLNEEMWGLALAASECVARQTIVDVDDEEADDEEADDEVDVTEGTIGTKIMLLPTTTTTTSEHHGGSAEEKSEEQPQVDDGGDDGEESDDDDDEEEEEVPDHVVDGVESDFAVRRLQQRVQHEAFLAQQEGRRQRWLDWQAGLNGSGTALIDRSRLPSKDVDLRFSPPEPVVTVVTTSKPGLTAAMSIPAVSRRDRAMAKTNNQYSSSSSSSAASTVAELAAGSSTSMPLYQHHQSTMDDAGAALLAKQVDLRKTEREREQEAKLRQQAEAGALMEAATKGAPVRTPVPPGHRIAGGAAHAIVRDHCSGQRENDGPIVIRGQQHHDAACDVESVASLMVPVPVPVISVSHSPRAPVPAPAPAVALLSASLNLKLDLGTVRDERNSLLPLELAGTTPTALQQEREREGVHVHPPTTSLLAYASQQQQQQPQPPSTHRPVESPPNQVRVKANPNLEPPKKVLMGLVAGRPLSGNVMARVSIAPMTSRPSSSRGVVVAQKARAVADTTATTAEQSEEEKGVEVSVA
jgi:hypothetical protein